MYIPSTFPRLHCLTFCDCSAHWRVCNGASPIVDLPHGHFTHRIICVCLARPGGGSASWPESVRPAAGEAAPLMWSCEAQPSLVRCTVSPQNAKENAQELPR